MLYAFVGDGEFSEAVAYHFRGDLHGDEFFTVVHLYCQPHHLGKYNHVSCVCANGFIGVILLVFSDFYEEFALRLCEPTFEASSLSAG